MAIDLLLIDANLAGKYAAQRDEVYRCRVTKRTGQHHSTMLRQRCARLR